MKATEREFPENHTAFQQIPERDIIDLMVLNPIDSNWRPMAFISG